MQSLHDADREDSEGYATVLLVRTRKFWGVVEPLCTFRPTFRDRPLRFNRSDDRLLEPGFPCFHDVDRPLRRAAVVCGGHQDDQLGFSQPERGFVPAAAAKLLRRRRNSRVCKPRALIPNREWHFIAIID